MSERLCTVDGCERPHVARGYCVKHYKTHWQKPDDFKRPTPCSVCGEIVMKKPTGSKTRRVVCSLLCRYYISWGKWPQSKWISDFEWPRSELPARHPARQVQQPPRLFVCCTCTHCGEQFLNRGGPSPYCSLRCTRRHHGRHSRHSERAAKFGTDSVSGLDWRAVALREGNLNCYICDVDCDPDDYERTAEGHFIVGPSYPSLDHILPLSKGGTHTPDNAALAHFRCNWEKSDTITTRPPLTPPAEQLALFAA